MAVIMGCVSVVVGLPALVVGVVVAVDKESYGLQEYGREESGEASSEL